ncbi:MAG TPA: hypothetical protein VMX94_04500 [Armatimonadota bacterium]|nr:hypothetical protein [Armatimonadota bacterium]
MKRIRALIEVLQRSNRLVRRGARVPAGRYQEVRKFYEGAIQAQKQQVVLRLEG